MYNGRFDPAKRMELARALSHHQFLRAADRVSDAGEGRPREIQSADAAPLRRRGRAAQSRGNRDLAEHFKLTIHDGYGQTETSSGCMRTCPARRCGPARWAGLFPVTRSRIVDENLRECAVGRRRSNCGAREAGQAAARSCASTGKIPRRTRSVFRGDYYLTGDQAYRDADGYLWFVGRADDVITSAGYRIGPFEVESALLEHPAVMESAVVASPDADRGAHRQGIRLPQAGRRRQRCPRARVAGARQAHHRALQVSARDRVRR